MLLLLPHVWNILISKVLTGGFNISCEELHNEHIDEDAWDLNF